MMDVSIVLFILALVLYIGSIVSYILIYKLYRRIEKREREHTEADLIVADTLHMTKEHIIYLTDLQEETLDKFCETLDNIANETKENEMACKRGGARKSAPKKSGSKKGGCKKGCRK